MFGYVRPNVKELKVKEHELYKSVYCGLCSVMGKRYSCLYKASLSYDYVFMVLLRLLTTPEKISFSKKRCPLHPTKKKILMDANGALEKTADVGVIMLYHNLLDKINDKDGIKSFLGYLLLPEAKRLRKKALKQSGVDRLDKIAQDKLNKLNFAEKERIVSVDIPAEIFGEFLGECLSNGLENDIRERVYKIGKSVGKWIYIVDAVDDIDSDEKKGCYNPFLLEFGSSSEAKKRARMIENTLLYELASADEALSSLENTDTGIFNILQNILRFRLPDIHDKIFEKNGFTKQR